MFDIVDNTKASILVIDDEELVRSLLKAVLEEQGYSVITAETTSKGLAYIMLYDFNLILLDLNMPGTDGAEIFREMKEVKGHLPVLIITGHHGSEMMERALNYDPLGILLKPFSDSDIINTVDSILSGVTTRS